MLSVATYIVISDYQIFSTFCLQPTSAAPTHTLSSATLGPFDTPNFTCRWSKFQSTEVVEKLAISTEQGMFVLDASNGFAELCTFVADRVETFDWSPTEDKVAVASGNSIRVFGGCSLDEALQRYEDVFDLDSPDGKWPCLDSAIFVDEQTRMLVQISCGESCMKRTFISLFRSQF
jgi:hypothetical protein